MSVSVYTFAILYTSEESGRSVLVQRRMAMPGDAEAWETMLEECMRNSEVYSLNAIMLVGVE